MIRKEDVADLREGDVVELSGHPMLKGATLRGPLYESGDGGELSVGDYIVRYRDGRPNLSYADRMSVLLVSRAPRPLYVNSDRTEPVPGDVVRDEDGGESTVWMAGLDYNGDHCWVDPERLVSVGKRMPRLSVQRLRLLVDGTTGQVVPS